jgi:exonuclease SbcC
VRLHRLRLTAFQAFAGSEQVDFDALAESGLFLLHGDTGAGKTTLLDAVTFALYGQVPGARARDARLRSDHAAPEVRTEVELEVTLRECRLRIVRRPAQTRPKVRGEGFTEDPPTCTVQELDPAGEWVTLAARPDEARHELGALLGMTCDQFCQIVLLPQGEFARFLRADSRERLPLLERLFGSDRFTRVEHWLNERRRGAWAELQSASQAVRELVAKVAEVGGEPAPEQLDLSAEWVAGLGVRAEAELVSAADAQRAASAARARAEAALAEGRAVAERRARHTAAVEDLADWETRRPQRDEAESQLAAARRAAPLATLLAGDRTPIADTDPHASPADLRARAAAARSEAGALDALVAVEARLVEADAELAALARQADEAGARARQAASAIEQAATERAAIEAAVQAAREAKAQAERLEAETRTAHERARRAVERDRLACELTSAQERRRKAVDDEQAAHSAWLDLRERRLAGMAAELAADLRPGEPCAVCGATEHPALAHVPEPAAPTGPTAATEPASTAAPPDPAAGSSPLAPHPPGLGSLAEQEQAAQAQHEQAVRARQAAEQDVARTEAALAAAQAVAGADPAGALTEHASRLDADLARARATADELPRAEQSLAALATRVGEHERTRHAATQAEAAARATHAERSGTLAADRARVEGARAAAASVAERAASLRDEADAADQEAAARDAGFTDASEARAAVLDADAIRALAQRIEDYDRGLAERRALAEQLARELADADAAARASADATPSAATAAQAGAAPAAPTSLVSLEAEATQAIEADDAATRRHALADQRVAALRRLAAELDQALTDLQPMAERERTVKQLATLVDGSAPANRLHMRLSAYVLAARLEEVAQAATVRLERMSNGRFQLIHTDERARKERLAGLELRVVDGWTGQERSPATLSGGETFLASLALALGLADVVAAEAGGSRLETLFVDEGFGSLDERTLDEVLDVLDQLREGGRTIGIVSHVAELRQRIPAKLRVVKSRTGSRVEHEQAALAA